MCRVECVYGHTAPMTNNRYIIQKCFTFCIYSVEYGLVCGPSYLNLNIQLEVCFFTNGICVIEISPL